MTEDNIEDLQQQDKMVHNKGTKEDFKQLQNTIQNLEIKAYSLQNLASNLKVDGVGHMTV
eukprot:3556229-Ditylum_brightwellii.AAC.1